MSELKFANTKWDARTWTQEQKIQWQERVFELGYGWIEGKVIQFLSKNLFYLCNDGDIVYAETEGCFPTWSWKTFEDMFTGEAGTLEPEVETRQSVFTHPRWVTCSTSSEPVSIGVTKDSDYKVIDMVYEGGKLHQYIICNDEGVADTYHISHFYKVTPEECTYLPPVETEAGECNGFENLVYQEPNIPRLDYWYIPLKNLSQDQINCFGENFQTDRRWSFGGTEDIIMYQVGNYDGVYVWTNTFERCDTKRMHKVSFNDIFQEVN